LHSRRRRRPRRARHRRPAPRPAPSVRRRLRAPSERRPRLVWHTPGSWAALPRPPSLPPVSLRGCGGAVPEAPAFPPRRKHHSHLSRTARQIADSLHSQGSKQARFLRRAAGSRRHLRAPRAPAPAPRPARRRVAAGSRPAPRRAPACAGWPRSRAPAAPAGAAAAARLRTRAAALGRSCSAARCCVWRAGARRAARRAQLRSLLDQET